MRRVFFSQNAGGGTTPVVSTAVVSTAEGVVSMVAVRAGDQVRTHRYFINVRGSLVYPPHDGVCVSVDVSEGDYVTVGQVVGTIKR